MIISETDYSNQSDIEHEMVDALPSNLRGIVWSATFAAAGAISGVVIDGICQKALRDQSYTVRGLVQFIVGVSALGPILQTLVPAEVQAPIGDGILMVFFYYFQPSLMRDIGLMLMPLHNMLWKDVPLVDKLADGDAAKVKDHRPKRTDPLPEDKVSGGHHEAPKAEPPSPADISKNVGLVHLRLR